MQDKELRISVHEQTAPDPNGYVVRVVLLAGDTVLRAARFPAADYSEAVGLAGAFQKLAGIPGGLDALFPSDEEGGTA